MTSTIKSIFKRTQAAILIASLCGSAAYANVPCASFSAPVEETTLSYDPFSPSAASTNFVLKAERGSNEVATIRAFLIDATPSGSSPRLGLSGPLEYDVVSRSGSSLGAVFGLGSVSLTSGNGLNLDFSSSAASTARLLVIVPALQLSGATTQRQRLEIAYKCYSSAGAEVGVGVQSSDNVQVQLDVLRVFGAFTGSQGNRTGQVDFGDIDVRSPSDQVKRAVVTAISSVQYNMSVASERGFMLRQTPLGRGLRYSATIDGLMITEPRDILCPRTGSSGREHQVVVTLDTSGAQSLPAGKYMDTLTVTFQARDGGFENSEQNCAVSRR